MFSVNPEELVAVREALREDPTNLGVGVLHVPTEQIVLRPFDGIPHRGGHLKLVEEQGWRPAQCLGFIVARPQSECVMVNLSQLNSQTGPLFMPQGTFRNVLQSLRQCWAGMAACGPTG